MANRLCDNSAGKAVNKLSGLGTDFAIDSLVSLQVDGKPEIDFGHSAAKGRGEALRRNICPGQYEEGHHNRVDYDSRRIRSATPPLSHHLGRAYDAIPCPRCLARSAVLARTQLLTWRHRSECELAHARQPKGARRRGGRRYCTNARACALRLSDGTTYCKQFASDSALCRPSCSLRYLSRQLITNCGRSRGRTFCSVACFWQPSTLSFSFALFAANS